MFKFWRELLTTSSPSSEMRKKPAKKKGPREILRERRFLSRLARRTKRKRGSVLVVYVNGALIVFSSVQVVKLEQHQVNYSTRLVRGAVSTCKPAANAGEHLAISAGNHITSSN